MPPEPIAPTCALHITHPVSDPPPSLYPGSAPDIYIVNIFGGTEGTGVT